MKKKTRATKPAASPALPSEAYDSQPLVQLTFTAETIWLTRFDGQGAALATYPVGASDCATAFRGQSGLAVSTGLLPADILFVMQQFGSGPRVGLWLPAGVRTIHWAAGRKDRALTLPLPGLVLVGQGLRYWVWAATARPAKESDPLYHAPLPNINSDGLICQGSVKFPKAWPDTLPAAGAAFLESQFNADLSGSRVKSQPKGLLAVLADLAKARTFPAAQLRPAGITFSQAMHPGNRGADGEATDEDDDNDDDMGETAETDPYGVLGGIDDPPSFRQMVEDRQEVENILRDTVPA